MFPKRGSQICLKMYGAPLTFVSLLNSRKLFILQNEKSNTLYSGRFESKKDKAQVCHWFWDVVTNDFDSEMKARLLQFVTGTSGVPSRGFSVLQGNDANIKKFTIHGVSSKQYHYPRAHTCFNRIDLPDYSSKKQLEERLRQAIVMSAQGFDIE